MKDIVAHCNKSTVKTEEKIKDTETHLINITEREEYQSTEKTIKNNEAKHRTSPTIKKVEKVQLFEIQTKFYIKGNTTTN